MVLVLHGSRRTRTGSGSARTVAAGDACAQPTCDVRPLDLLHAAQPERFASASVRSNWLPTARAAVDHLGRERACRGTSGRSACRTAGSAARRRACRARSRRRRPCAGRSRSAPLEPAERDVGADGRRAARSGVRRASVRVGHCQRDRAAEHRDARRGRARAARAGRRASCATRRVSRLGERTCSRRPRAAPRRAGGSSRRLPRRRCGGSASGSSVWSALRACPRALARRHVGSTVATPSRARRELGPAAASGLERRDRQRGDEPRDRRSPSSGVADARTASGQSPITSVTHRR